MIHTFDINTSFCCPSEASGRRDREPCDPFLMHRSARSLQGSSIAGAMQLPRSDLQPPSSWTCGPLGWRLKLGPNPFFPPLALLLPHPPFLERRHAPPTPH